MTYKYTIVKFSIYDTLEYKIGILNQLGYAGWELIFVYFNPANNSLEYHFKWLVT